MDSTIEGSKEFFAKSLIMKKKLTHFSLVHSLFPWFSVEVEPWFFLSRIGYNIKSRSFKLEFFWILVDFSPKSNELRLSGLLAGDFFAAAPSWVCFLVPRITCWLDSYDSSVITLYSPLHRGYEHEACSSHHMNLKGFGLFKGIQSSRITCFALDFRRSSEGSCFIFQPEEVNVCSFDQQEGFY